MILRTIILINWLYLPLNGSQAFFFFSLSTSLSDFFTHLPISSRFYFFFFVIALFHHTSTRFATIISAFNLHGKNQNFFQHLLAPGFQYLKLKCQMKDLLSSKGWKICMFRCNQLRFNRFLWGNKD